MEKKLTQDKDGVPPWERHLNTRAMRKQLLPLLLKMRREAQLNSN